MSMQNDGQAPNPFQHSRAHTWPVSPTMMRPVEGPALRQPKPPTNKGKLFFLLTALVCVVLVLGTVVVKALTSSSSAQQPTVVASSVPPPTPTSLREPSHRLVPLELGSATASQTMPPVVSVSIPPLIVGPTTPSGSSTSATVQPTSTKPSSSQPPTTAAPTTPAPVFVPFVAGWLRALLAPADLSGVGSGAWSVTQPLNETTPIAQAYANPLAGCSANPAPPIPQQAQVLTSGSGATVVSRVLEKTDDVLAAMTTMNQFRATISSCPTRAWGSGTSTWTVARHSPTPFGEILMVKRRAAGSGDTGTDYVAVRYERRIAMVDYSNGGSAPDPAVTDQLVNVLRRQICYNNGAC